MILKAPDAKRAAVTELEKILLTADKEKQLAIARELLSVRTAINNEGEAVYLINFHLRHSHNTVVLHDLRLVLEDGSAAHIDHLLIHRSYRFYILDSKHFTHDVKINDRGQFLRWHAQNRAYEHVPSPLEHNAWRTTVLRQVLKSFGMQDVHIQSFALIAPHAHIARPLKFDAEQVVQADQFMLALNENLENASFMGLLTASAQAPMLPPVSEIAERLIALHQPAVVDYANKVWLSEISSSTKGMGTENSRYAAEFKTVP